MKSFRPFAPLLPALLALAAWSAAPAAETPESADFFEKRIRPVLSDKCYKCHSDGAEKLKGGLLVDSREALLKGGDTGAAIAPGEPDKSLFVEAIRWKNEDMQMPPKTALAPEQVADLEAWIKAGAPWPQEAKSTKVATKPVFDLQRRKAEHWCWEPIVEPAPPSIKAAAWPKQTLDRFILARLEEKGLAPAPATDRRTLLRRASFDLTGLPPTPAQVEAFAADPAPDAFEKVVDGLLASPHFGERWARHWLDLVRYAETRGHEFDPDIPNAWQYRDYVIRAFNADVPYNQFASEHLAGDLLPARVNAATGANESILGTGFWFLGEEIHSPVDIRQDEADRMDNRLDVMGKTFLGLTIGCARCHDHKFDAISQRDYYALQGFLISSSYRQARFETLEPHRLIFEQLSAARAQARPALLKATAAAIAPALSRLPETLLAGPEASATLSAALKAAASDPLNPLHAFAKTAAAPDFSRALSSVLADLQKRALPAAAPAFLPEQIVADFSQGAPLLQDGFSFSAMRAGDPFFGSTAAQPLVGIASRGAAVRDLAWRGLTVKSGTREVGKLGTWERAEQILRTPETTLTGERLWYLVKGAGRAYAAVNSHLLINGPLHGALLREWKAEGERWHWVEHPLSAYTGHRLHVEFSPADDGNCAIAMVVQAAEKPPLPGVINARLLSALRDPAVTTPAALAEATRAVLQSVCAKLAAAPCAEDADLADWLVGNLELFAPTGSAPRTQLAQSAAPLLAAQSGVIAKIRPDSQSAPAMFEGSGANEFVLVRGQTKAPGAMVPRRFLEALAGAGQPEIKTGSGRLELARRVVDPANPLTSRVMVNRVWYHLFGRGIVPTVDNFGVLGQAPSHRELLDFLSARFVKEQGWSLKALIREVVLSSTYQMASRPDDAGAEAADPENLLLHRMNVRRLEGEAIRDSILTVSGRLDPKLGGPSVPVHLNEFMDGRGRPGNGGPLDGAGRRSIYTQVRRNFLSPMMLAFDTPIPFNAMGRRNVSNVPAQALILMNDPFVVEQAGLWAKRLSSESEPAARIRAMYLSAFARPPSAEELADAAAFVQSAAPSAVASGPDVWADLSHVLFNVKEFIYLN